MVKRREFSELRFHYCPVRYKTTLKEQQAKMWLIDEWHNLIVFYLLLNPFCFCQTKLDVHYCGFEQSCKQNKSDVELKTNSCCLPCECTDICKEKDTCCHDKEGRGETRDVIPQECIRALYLPDGTWNDQNYAYGVQSYLVRSRCPVSFKDNHIKDKCENPNPKSMQELVFVSTKDGKITYKNEFCALCHQDSVVVSWKINAFKIKRCRMLMSKEHLNVASATEFILNNCAVSFERPSNVDLQTVICFNENVIGKCNETGKWDVFDSNLERMCLNPPESVYYVLTAAVYRNLYCYLCNVGTNTIPETCNRTSYFRDPFESSFSLTNLLQSPLQHSNEDNECKADEIYDTFLGRCKTLYCPTYSLSANGQCIPFLNAGQSYRLVIRLVPQGILLKSESLNRALSYQLPVIRHQLGFGHCELCHGILYVEDNNDTDYLEEIDIQLALGQTEKCTTESIWSKVTLIERNETTVKLILDERKFLFNALWDYNDLIPRSKIKYTFGKTRHINECRSVYTGCPKILLTMKEYKKVLDNHPNANDLLFKQRMDGGNGTVFVCIQSYLSDLRSAAVQAAVSLPHIITATILLHHFI